MSVLSTFCQWFLHRLDQSLQILFIWCPDIHSPTSTIVGTSPDNHSSCKVLSFPPPPPISVTTHNFTFLFSLVTSSLTCTIWSYNPSLLLHLHSDNHVMEYSFSDSLSHRAFGKYKQCISNLRQQTNISNRHLDFYLKLCYSMIYFKLLWR